MPKQKDSIPRSVVRRLTGYLAHVQELCAQKIDWTSSQELADAFGLTSSTVRQDLSHIAFSGTSKKGYYNTRFLAALTETLGADRGWNVVVIGAGNLGKALVMSEELQRRNFKICGVFDCDEKKIGKRLDSFVVQSMKELPASIGNLNVDIGILAVPASTAQQVADLLIASSIRGLLNLSLTHIVAPQRVKVVDIRIVSGLLELTHAIKDR